MARIFVASDAIADRAGPMVVTRMEVAAGGASIDADARKTAWSSIITRPTPPSPAPDRRRGDIGQKDFDKFVQVSREIASLPIEIDDTPSISMSALRTRCRRLKRTKGLALVVVDYLQLMHAGTKVENRVLEISMITQGLKGLAKEMAVPVLALSQLSRQVENRDDRRPQLSDLRESGSIEQDADAVMFVYRDEYYLEQRMPKEVGFTGGADKFNAAMDDWQMSKAHNRADLIIAKQRHGPTGTIPLLFEGEFTRFGDIDLVHSEYV